MTPQYLPGFHLQTLRKTPRSTAQKMCDQLALLKQKSLSQLGDYFTTAIPKSMLNPPTKGNMSRRRIFSLENTFWAFFSQVLDADGGCQEVVRKTQAQAHLKGWSIPSSSTAAYCKARSNLPQKYMESIYQQSTHLLSDKSSSTALNGRRVIVVDGTGISMPDTLDNQSVWPQYKSQKKGCGFPQAFICASFNLHTGSLISYQMGNKKSHELPMLRQQLKSFTKGDIFLGDKGFCSYYDQSTMADKGIDSVITLARRKPIKASEAQEILGKNDLIIEWKKPVWSSRCSYSKSDWISLPKYLKLRQIKVEIKVNGFRSKSYYLITTLLDAKSYTAAELANLYLERWHVEGYFRDLKTTMGMDILRCKTPAMIHKEVQMYMIVYNCIRHLIYHAAKAEKKDAKRVSFKGCIQVLRHWILDTQKTKGQVQRQQEMKQSIVNKMVPLRSFRSEPRAVKRRPKPYQLMTKPRHEMHVSGPR
jgi:hypothetical protein